LDAPLSRSTLLAYGALGFPLAALNLPLYVYLPAFYAEEVGIGLATVGAVLLVARLLDTVTDPLIGELGDRLPTRFGRRRPWLVAALPLLMVATWMLFRPADGVGWVHLLSWSILAYLAWTAMLLPYAAWGAELSADYHERSRVTAAREGAVVLGILFAAALPALLGIGAQTKGPILEALAWIMLIFLPLTLLILLMVVPEGHARPGAAIRFADGVRIALRNRAFLRLVAAYLLNGVSNGLPATLFLLFVGDRLGLPAAAGGLLLVYFAAGFAAIPFWLRLSRRVGKHRAWSAAMLWACAAFVWVPLLGPGDLLPFAVISLFSGLSLGADLALPASIQADVVDLDRVETGRQRTGLFFAIWSMSTKLALALAVGLAFPILDMAGFTPGGDNDPVALGTLAVLYGLAPVLIKLGATTLVWNFPIDAATQADLHRRIQAAEGQAGMATAR
jgi:GPH family glycoside/pentoside/hexuronide:cation symporter